MKLPKISTPGSKGTCPNRPWRGGFTLIEIIISIAILSVILGLGLIVTLDFYRRYAFHYEETLIVSLLERARSQALANVNEEAHGLCKDGDSYSLFGISGGCSSGIKTPASSVVDVNFEPGSPDEVVFSPLSARTSSTTIVVTDTSSNQTSHIQINEEGGIEY